MQRPVRFGGDENQKWVTNKKLLRREALILLIRVLLLEKMKVYFCDYLDTLTCFGHKKLTDISIAKIQVTAEN